jgi:hypothetical protein
MDLATLLFVSGAWFTLTAITVKGKRMPLLPLPMNAPPVAVSAATAVILASLIDKLIANGSLTKADATDALNNAVKALGAGSEPAIYAGKLAERLAK